MLLQKLTFVKDCKVYGVLAFSECESLIEINIPSTVRSVGGGCFSRKNTDTARTIKVFADNVQLGSTWAGDVKDKNVKVYLKGPKSAYACSNWGISSEQIFFNHNF